MPPDESNRGCTVDQVMAVPLRRPSMMSLSLQTPGDTVQPSRRGPMRPRSPFCPPVAPLSSPIGRPMTWPPRSEPLQLPDAGVTGHRREDRSEVDNGTGHHGR